MKKHILAILGYSSSGKDTVARILQDKYNYHFVVSTTTRPKRSNEVHGQDYFYLSEEKFNKLINENKLVEYRYYDTIQNGKQTRWHYGITADQIDHDENSVVVVDTIGLRDLKHLYGSDVISTFIDVDYDIRRDRAMARDRYFEEAEFERRNSDDLIKFDGFVPDIYVRNDNLDECVKTIMRNVKIKTL